MACLGAPGGVRRAGHRRGGSHCAGVRIYAMGRRQRGDHLARHRARDVDRFVSTRHGLPEPRPRLWSMRLMLIRDSVHHV